MSSPTTEELRTYGETEPRECRACWGAGRVAVVRGCRLEAIPCPACGGEGEIYREGAHA